MSKKEKTIDWQDLYDYWKRYSRYLPELQFPLQGKRIEINERIFGSVYHYNWLNKSKEEQEIEEDKRLITSTWIDPGNQWSRGTIHTAGLLMECETAEEMAAIWLCAFAHTIERNKNNRDSLSRLAAEIQYKACPLFAQKYGYWHHQSRDFFPEFYIMSDLLWEENSISIPAFIELAVLNAALVMDHYTPVEYKIQF